MREGEFRLTEAALASESPFPHPPPYQVQGRLYGHPVSSTGQALLPMGEGKSRLQRFAHVGLVVAIRKRHRNTMCFQHRGDLALPRLEIFVGTLKLFHVVR